MPNNPPTQDELELIAFAAAEKDEYRPMISTADAGSDCPTFERLAEIIAAQAEAIDALETECDLWKSTAKGAQDQKEQADYRGESFAKAIEDYNEMRDQRDAARASTERNLGALENALAENTSLRERMGDLQGRLWSVKETRDHLRKDVKRLDDGWCDAIETLSNVRKVRNEAQGRIVELEQERDDGRAEVEFQAEDLERLQRLADIRGERIGRYLDDIQRLESQCNFWRGKWRRDRVAPNEAAIAEDQRKIRDMSAKLREHRTCEVES